MLRAEELGIGCAVVPQSGRSLLRSAYAFMEGAAVNFPDVPGANFMPTLVVDANPSAAERLAKQLEHFGFAVDTVDSCWGALTAVRARHYGTLIFVSDPSQPHYLECIAGVRRQVPRTWIVAISSTAMSDAGDLFLRYGVDALIVTPFSMEDLVSRLLAFSRRSRPP